MPMSVAGVEIECKSDQSTDDKIKNRDRERGDHSRVTKIEKYQLFTTPKAIDGSDLARMSKILFQFCSMPCPSLVQLNYFFPNTPWTHGQACPIRVCVQHGHAGPFDMSVFLRFKINDTL